MLDQSALVAAIAPTVAIIIVGLQNASRFKAIDTRFNGIDQRLDRIEQMLQHFIDLHINHADRLARLEEKTKKIG